jgi:TRAP transporter TAXI family solute receptor
MKKLLILITICIGLVSCNQVEETYEFATGGPAGTYYPLGNSIAELLTDTNTTYFVTTYSTNASIQNCELIQSSKMDMAIVQSNVAYWARNGKGMFEEKLDELSGITSLYTEVIQVVVKDDSDIQTITDLKGKSVNIGEVDSGNYFDAINILRAYGMTEKDIVMKNKSSDDTIADLLNEEIDAVILTAGIPTKTIKNLSSEMDIRILTLDDIFIDELILAEPYLTKVVIPKETYNGLEEEVITIGTDALWVASKYMDDDIVYEMTMHFFENLNKLSFNSKNADAITLDSALSGMSIPLHPGAKRYYEEKGLISE